MKIIKELRSSTNKLYLTIYFDEQEKWVDSNWSGYVSPENVKKGSLAVLDALIKYKSPCYLNNNTDLVGTWDQAVDWIEQVWTPRAVAAGLRFFAHIVNEEAFAAASAADMLRRVSGQFTMQIFNNRQDAQHWLQSCMLVTLED